jgi:hypothetical protein
VVHFEQAFLRARAIEKDHTAEFGLWGRRERRPEYFLVSSFWLSALYCDFSRVAGQIGATVPPASAVRLKSCECIEMTKTLSRESVDRLPVTAVLDIERHRSQRRVLVLLHRDERIAASAVHLVFLSGFLYRDVSDLRRIGELLHLNDTVRVFVRDGSGVIGASRSSHRPLSAFAL